MAPSFRHAPIIMALGLLVTPVRSDSCLPAVDVDTILQSVDSFLVRQMDRFPVPGDYPPGYQEPQLIQTYDFTESELSCVPPYWRADAYDTALAAFYFTQRGDFNRARSLLDGARLVQAYDPIGDGRIRTSYHANDLLGASGQAWFDDSSAATGNMAWLGIAFPHFFQATGEQQYLDAAKDIAEWINDPNHTRQPVTLPDDPFGGFSLGEDGACNPIGGTTKGRSTEHNIDVYVLASNLYQLEYDQKWLGMAQHAQAFVQQMFHETGGKYWIGTKWNSGSGQIEINYWPQSTDAQAWTALTDADTDERASRALDWLTDPVEAMLVKDVVCSTGTCEDPCSGPCDLCYCEPGGT